MKITITGSNGFVGVNIQKYLKKSYEIETISVRFKPNQQLNINGDVIIHLAGKAHDLKKTSKPEEYYEANFELTKQLFDAFLFSDSSVFIFMSSVKAIADEINGILLEDDIPNPKTHYGISKLYAENYILSKKLPEGKRVFILRPCIIHGPDNKGNLNLLYQFVAKGIPWPLGSFDNRRSFLSIENLCFVIQELINNPTIISDVYQVADDGVMSVNEVIKLFSEKLNKKVKILKINASLMKLIARLGDLLNFPLNSDRLQKLTENYVVSNDKIVKILKKKLPIEIDKGLLHTIESFNK